ncbi:MAG: ACP S-malonyltransferase [Lactobacillales bacterium]|jgi:[acyl-carrier-protein] S-malonyltransferase|nr:ACP S-malonyltransferase [Lactobacillales bacterium]
MSKIAIAFAGQGAQYVGMGRELYDAHGIVRETFNEASEVLGYDIAELIFNEEEKLNETRYTQPAILTVSIAMYRLLGVKPDAVLGLSLGEYSALVASGALDFKDAVALVAKRGKYMSEAAPAGVGKMVAVMNTPREVIEKACEEASVKGIVTPANYNTPVQIVIGGEVAAVDYAKELLEAAGAKRMIDLNVSGPFHTALLEPASVQLAEALKDVNFGELEIPVISNTTAKAMPDNADEIKELLRLQVMKSVRFEDSIYTLRDEFGIDTIIEVGPGKTLTSFMKKIDKEITALRVEDEASLEATKAAL